MSHTNPSYDGKFEAISLGDLPSNKQYTLSPGLSPGKVRRISDSPRYLDIYSISRASAENIKPNDNSFEQQVPNKDKKDENMPDDDDSYYSIKTFT